MITHENQTTYECEGCCETYIEPSCIFRCDICGAEICEDCYIPICKYRSTDPVAQVCAECHVVFIASISAAADNALAEKIRTIKGEEADECSE